MRALNVYAKSMSTVNGAYEFIVSLTAKIYNSK